MIEEAIEVPEQSIAVLSNRAQAVAIIDDATRNQIVTYGTMAGRFVETNAVTDQNSYDQMVLAGSVLAMVEKKLTAWHEPRKSAAFNAHRQAVADERAEVGPIIQAKTRAGDKVLAFTREQERLRQAEQQRLQEEADAEQKRQADEVAAELRKQMKAEGAKPAEIKQVVAEVKQEAARPAPAPIAQRTFTPSKDMRKTAEPRWSARIISLRQLCKAVGEGAASENLVIGIRKDEDTSYLTSPGLNDAARGAKSTVIGIPGVVGVQKESNASFKTTR